MADKVNWAQKIRQPKSEENLKAILQKLEKAQWSMPRGFSAASVREDRDIGRYMIRKKVRDKVGSTSLKLIFQ